MVSASGGRQAASARSAAMRTCGSGSVRRSVAAGGSSRLPAAGQGDRAVGGDDGVRILQRRVQGGQVLIGDKFLDPRMTPMAVALRWRRSDAWRPAPCL